MSVEACRRNWNNKGRTERDARGFVDEKRCHICLDCVGLPLFLRFIPNWVVYVFAYETTTSKYFYRRDSANSYFEKLVKRHGLTETDPI